MNLPSLQSRQATRYVNTFNALAKEYHKIGKKDRDHRPPVRDIVPFPSKHLEGIDFYIPAILRVLPGDGLTVDYFARGIKRS